MRKIQQKIFQSSVFQKLGTLKSSTRNPHLAGFDVRTASLEIEQLRYDAADRIVALRQTGVSHPNDFIQFFASKEYEDLFSFHFSGSNMGVR
jgi:hypothetical protein